MGFIDSLLGKKPSDSGWTPTHRAIIKELSYDEIVSALGRPQKAQGGFVYWRGGYRAWTLTTLMGCAINYRTRTTGGSVTRQRSRASTASSGSSLPATPSLSVSWRGKSAVSLEISRRFDRRNPHPQTLEKQRTARRRPRRIPMG